MPELEPITREEKFLNGEVGMTPITREEKILAGEDIETVTRREYFLKKYRGGGGGDVTVVPLSVTDNGTYSEEGKAYSPVSVDVPLPQNAYLLKSVPNLPQAIASFNDGEEMVMPSLKVSIEPQQDLHGYDAPWAGGAGKNKFDQDTAYASYKQSDGSFRITGNAVTIMKNYIPLSLVGQQVTVSVYFDLTKEASPNGVRIACNIGGTETESGRVEANEKKTLSLTFTPTASTDYWYITYGNTGANYFYFKECQLEIGSTATSYAPYKNECPISGWSSVNVVDMNDATKISFFKGLLRGNYGFVDLSTVSWTASTFGSENVWSASLPTNCKGYSDSVIPTTVLCENYEVTSVNNIYSALVDGIALRNNGGKLYVTRTDTNEPTGYLIFELETPTTPTITAEQMNTLLTAFNLNGYDITIALGYTYYGGYIDWENNNLVVNRGYVDLGSFSAESWTRNGVQLFWSHTIEDMAEGTANVMCSEYKYVSKSWTTLVDYEFGVSSNSIRLHNENVSTKEELVNSLDGVQLVYELATPITIPLQLPQVKTLEGVNNVWADTGDITDAEYFSKEV